MKIGRREHLRQLGLGAAGMLGAGLFADDLSVSANQRASRRLQARPWPWISVAPSGTNRGIRVVFAGMMIFTYNERQGQVVFHRSPAHKLQIVVLPSDGCTPVDIKHLPPEVVIPDTDIPEGSTIDLVIPERDYSDVTFFQTGDHDDFDRTRWNKKDSRWLLDLEGPEPFDNRDFKRTDAHGFNTKLQIQSGQFYTYQRTNSTFTADKGALKGQVFHVAKVMACDIRLTNQEQLLLKINGTTFRTMRNPTKYEVYFLNVPTCNPCKTSEFPMVFDAIRDPEAYKFDLQLVYEGRDEAAKNLCVKIGGANKFTDETPCMGAGFGAGRGFPG